jgi:hypothetical protein
MVSNIRFGSVFRLDCKLQPGSKEPVGIRNLDAFASLQDISRVPEPGDIDVKESLKTVDQDYKTLPLSLYMSVGSNSYLVTGKDAGPLKPLRDIWQAGVEKVCNMTPTEIAQDLKDKVIINQSRQAGTQFETAFKQHIEQAESAQKIQKLIVSIGDSNNPDQCCSPARITGLELQA